MKKPRKASDDHPGLFGDPTVAKQSLRQDDPPAPKRHVEKTTDEYVAEWNAKIETINSASQADRVRYRWRSEEDERRKLGIDLKDERLLKAALDGRCNRVRDGFAPIGRD